jgi:hypothetical protein
MSLLSRITCVVKEIKYIDRYFNNRFGSLYLQKRAGFAGMAEGFLQNDDVSYRLAAGSFKTNRLRVPGSYNRWTVSSTRAVGMPSMPAVFFASRSNIPAGREFAMLPDS